MIQMDGGMGSVAHPVSLTIQIKPPSSYSRLPSPSKLASLLATSTSVFHFARRVHRSERGLRHPALGSVNPVEEDPESPIYELRVPDAWLHPSNALEESEWLRVTLHKWLDDEYCPEPANIEISKLAARSYYESLIAKQADLGDILLKMVSDLETLSFQESFHGPFSSANAAVHLITQRINSAVQ